MALDNTSGPFSYHEFPRNPTPLPSRLRSPSVKDMWRGVAAKWGHHSSGISLHPFHQPVVPSAPG